GAAAGRPGGVLVLAVRERARPRDRHAAAAAPRAAARPRHRFLRGVSHRRAELPPHAGHAAAPGDLPRLQRLRGRPVPRPRGPGDPGRDHPMYTPEEAIEEIEFAATQLGYRV